MKTYTILIFLSLMLVASISLVIAAQENGSNQQVQAKNKTQQNEVVAAMNKTNMTYGQCVSAGAAVKNTCYEQIKQTALACGSTTAKDKAMKKECKSTYKTQKKFCQDSFKQYKISCKQIKHNFLETLRYSLA